MSEKASSAADNVDRDNNSAKLTINTNGANAVKKNCITFSSGLYQYHINSGTAGARPNNNLSMPMPLRTYYIQPNPSNYIPHACKPKRLIIRPLSEGGRFISPSVVDCPTSVSGAPTNISLSKCVASATPAGSAIRNTDKSTQVTMESCTTLKRIIARQRKMISQLVKIIVREGHDEPRTTGGSDVHRTADISSGKIESISTAGSAGQTTFQVIQSDASNQTPITIAERPNGLTEDIPTESGKDHTHSTREKNQDCPANVLTDDELLELGRRTVKMLSPNDSSFVDVLRNQIRSILESFRGELGLDRKSRAKLTPKESDRQRRIERIDHDASTEECSPDYSKQCLVGDVERSGTEDKKRDEIVHAEGVSEIDPTTEESHPTKPAPTSPPAIHAPKKAASDCMLPDSTKKRRAKRLTGRDKLSADESIHEEVGFRRSPRKRTKPVNPNDYIKRSASKQASQKIHNILKGSNSEVSVHSDSPDAEKRVRGRSKRRLSPPAVNPTMDQLEDIERSSENEIPPQPPGIIVKEERMEQFYGDVYFNTKVQPQNSIIPHRDDLSDHTVTYFRDMSLTSAAANRLETRARSVSPGCVNFPENADSNRDSTVPTTVLPHNLVVKLEKIDAPSYRISQSGNEAQTQALDLRINKGSNSRKQTSPLLINALSEPFVKDHDEITVNSVYSTSSIHYRNSVSAGPSRNAPDSIHPTHESRHGASDYEMQGRDCRTRKRTLDKWLDSNIAEDLDLSQLKPTPVIPKSLKKVVKPRAGKSGGMEFQEYISPRKRRRPGRTNYTDKNVSSLTLGGFEGDQSGDSNGRDNSSDSVTALKKTKKRKRKRDYRKPKLSKKTNNSENDAEMSFPFVVVSSDSTASSDVDATAYEVSSLFRYSQQPNALLEQSSDTKCQPIQRDSVDVSRYSPEGSAHDPYLSDLPIPASTVSELELAIERMKEKIERVTREREERLSSELPLDDPGEHNSLLMDRLFDSIADRDVSKLDHALESERRNEVSIGFGNGVPITKDSLTIQSGHTVREGGDAVKIHRKHLKVKRAGGIREGACKRITENGSSTTKEVVEWTMEPRKACKDAREKINRLVNPPQIKKHNKMAKNDVATS